MVLRHPAATPAEFPSPHVPWYTPPVFSRTITMSVPETDSGLTRATSVKPVRQFEAGSA